MPDFYTITQDEFETAARFLQVVALMEGYSWQNYEKYFYCNTSGYYRDSEDRDKLREWLDSHVPTCADWTSNPAKGTTVQWDGTVLSLQNREGVLAKFNLPMLLEKTRRHDRYAHIHGADVTNNAPHNAFEGRTDLRKLVVVGTLGKVLSLLPEKNASLWDIADARKSVRRTLQDAGIYVEPSASDSAFDDQLIVWGYYGAPIGAIERGAASEKKKQRKLGVIELFKPNPAIEVGVAVVPDTWREAKPAKTEAQSERRAKLYTWVAAGIVALILLAAGVVSWNESNPGIFIEVSCMVAAWVVAYLAILDT